jgi:hypothetical protein
VTCRAVGARRLLGGLAAPPARRRDPVHCCYTGGQPHLMVVAVPGWYA